MVRNRLFAVLAVTSLVFFSATASAVTTVDILMLYAPSITSPESRAVAMETYANQALANSQSDIRFRIVHVQAFDIPNPKTDEVTLNVVKDNPQIQALRTQWGADLVSYMTPTGPFCGVAYLSPGDSTTGNLYSYSDTIGFSVVGHTCTSSFAHEIGHNLSLGHSFKQNSPGSVFPWGRGYGVDGDFVTVMAYTSAFGAGRVQYFSNPAISACHGSPCGLPRTQNDGADGVGAMAVTGPQIAAWRVPSTPPAVNSPPVAAADVVVVPKNAMWDIDVLANDSDVDGDALSLSSVTQGAHGLVEVSGNLVVYTPNGNFVGEDNFSYVVSDVFNATATGNVRVLVGMGLEYEYFEGGNWSALPNFDTLIPVATGLARNFDISLAQRSDDFAFRFRGLINIATAGTYTFFTASDDGSRVLIDGAVVADNDGRHSLNETSGSLFLGTGLHDIEVQYFDALGSEMLNVSWQGPGIAKQLIPGGVLRQGFGTAGPPPNINPIANLDEVYIDTPQAIDIDVLANDSDVDNDPLTITNVTGASKGSTQIIAGKVRYTPVAGAEGTDLFAYTISDGRGGSATASVLVGIGEGLRYQYYEGVFSALPDFPSLTPVKQGSSLDFSLSEAQRGVNFAFRYLGSIVIPENGSYTFHLGSDDGSRLLIDGQPVVQNDGIHGYVELAANATLTAGAHDIEVQFFQNSGSSRLTLQWSGSSFPKQAVQARDLLQRIAGTTPRNTAPTALDDVASTPRGQAVSIDVLANDSDPDGDALSITTLGQPANGSVSLVAGKVNYTPAAGFSGADSFNYTISDGQGHSASANVQVTVTASPPAGPVDVVLQEGLNGYQGSADTWISVFHKTNNFGGIADIKDKDGWYDMLVRFPVFQSEGGPVPDGATIESATLSLYKTSYYDHVYTATRILKAWQETAVSWNNRLPGTAWSVPGVAGTGSDIATAPDGQGSVGFSPNQWLNIDVTNGVQTMSAGAVNQGWLIDGVSGNNNLKHFNSREVANAGLRPKLSIRYTLN